MLRIKITVAGLACLLALFVASFTFANRSGQRFNSMDSQQNNSQQNSNSNSNNKNKRKPNKNSNTNSNNEPNTMPTPTS